MEIGLLAYKQYSKFESCLNKLIILLVNDRPMITFSGSYTVSNSLNRYKLNDP